jgi:hypothetical protein
MMDFPCYSFAHTQHFSRRAGGRGILRVLSMLSALARPSLLPLISPRRQYQGRDSACLGMIPTTTLARPSLHQKTRPAASPRNSRPLPEIDRGIVGEECAAGCIATRIRLNRISPFSAPPALKETSLLARRNESHERMISIRVRSEPDQSQHFPGAKLPVIRRELPAVNSPTANPRMACRPGNASGETG